MKPYTYVLCVFLGLMSLLCHGLSLFNTSQDTLIITGTDKSGSPFSLELPPLKQLSLPELASNSITYSIKDTLWKQYVVNPFNSFLKVVGLKKDEPVVHVSQTSMLQVKPYEPNQSASSLVYVDTKETGKELISVGPETHKGAAARLIAQRSLRKNG